MNSVTTPLNHVATLQALPNLTALDLSHNKLATVPSSISTLLSLVTLHLQGNPFKMLPLEFLLLTSIKELNLGLFNGTLDHACKDLECCAATLTSREADKFMPLPAPDENYLTGVHYDSDEEDAHSAGGAGVGKRTLAADLFADDSVGGAGADGECDGVVTKSIFTLTGRVEVGRIQEEPVRRQSVVAREKKVQFASNFFDLELDPKEQHVIEVAASSADQAAAVAHR
jgi:hypothetical protein